MGLFGSNMGARGTMLGGGDYRPQQRIAMPAPQQAPQSPQPRQRSTGQRVAGYLADALAGLAGQQGPYAAMIARENHTADQEAAYQRQRADAYADWQRRQAWERANPAPANNDTTNDYTFIAQTLGKDAADNYLRNLGDPMVTVQLPGNRVYSGPRSGMAGALSGGGAPTAPVGKLTPIEGGPASAPGTFRP